MTEHRRRPDRAAAGRPARRARSGARRARALAAGLERGRSLFCETNGVGSEREWRERARAEGFSCSCMNIGLATWADTREALGLIYENALSRGVRPPDRFNLLAERRMGLPKDKRAEAPQETGPALWSDQDWWELAHTVPIQPEAADNMIGGPGSVENATDALRVGITHIGVLSQYSWRWPYWDDDVSQTMAVLRSRRPARRLPQPRASASTPTSRTATRASSTTTPTTSAGRCSSATSARS